MPRADALRLIDVVSFGGARQIAFAGGDPSLRRDIADLCNHARLRGLEVEIQTNGDIHTQELVESLDSINSLALSIDSGDPSIHDEIRGSWGNFERCISLARMAHRKLVPIRNRSVVTTATAPTMDRLALALIDAGVDEWVLQELAPVGLGITTQQVGLSAEEVDVMAGQLSVKYPMLQISTNSSAHKSGLYAMMRSDGGFYGTAGNVDLSGYYPTVGNILVDHLASMVEILPFHRAAHEARYL